MKINKSRLYWICQFVGWGGLVGCETANYILYYLNSEGATFDFQEFISFIYYALIGILLTHILRKILLKKQIFKNSLGHILLLAFISVLSLSLLLSIFGLIPQLITYGWVLFEKFSFLVYIGNLINITRYTVVWVSFYFLYKVLAEISLIREDKLAVENLAKSTELELLKTQLNPHFLFNALNSIKALVIIDPEKSKDAIVKLSELLRFTLNYGHQILISVFDEIQEVKKYLSLEQIRFGNRLILKFDVAEDTYNKALPPAVILTLAENAVKHGIAKRAGEGIIQIKSQLTDGKLSIQVINTGNLVNEGSTGIGVKIVKKRLEEIFSSNASFQLSEQDEYVKAEVIIKDR